MVALQYIVPILIILFNTFLLKTLGNYNWSGAETEPFKPYELVAGQKFSIQELKLAFNPTVFRGLLSFMNWWMISVLFATEAIGLVYHNYFSY